MKRHLTSFALSAALVFAPVAAMAADSTQAQPQPSSDLAPGPAAGVQHAQDIFAGGTATYAVVGIVAVAVIVAAASGGGGGGSSPSTTGTLP